MEELILKQMKFKEDLVNLINDSHLPALIIKPIISETFEQITILEQRQYEEALKIKAEKEEENKEEE